MRKSLASFSMHSFSFAHLAQVCASCVYELVHTNNYPVDKRIRQTINLTTNCGHDPALAVIIVILVGWLVAPLGESNLALTQNAGIPEKCINFPPFPYHFRSAHNQYFMLVK